MLFIRLLDVKAFKSTLHNWALEDGFPFNQCTKGEIIHITLIHVSMIYHRLTVEYRIAVTEGLYNVAA